MAGFVPTMIFEILFIIPQDIRERMRQKEIKKYENTNCDDVPEDITTKCFYIYCYKNDKDLKKYLKTQINDGNLSYEQGAKLFYEHSKNKSFFYKQRKR